jgi:hypothetical protein
VTVKYSTDISPDRVRELLNYCPETGIFTRAITTGYRGCHKAGDAVGSISCNGYFLIGIQRRQYAAHRLAWVIIHGYWPSADIDHIDGDRLNNSLRNLREATRSENNQNIREARKHNATKLLGASFRKDTGKYTARIVVDGKAFRLGCFKSAEEAHAAYIKAKSEIHPFAPHISLHQPQ